MNVRAVNLTTGHVLLEDGSGAFVTNWFDILGDEIPDSNGAISAVARVNADKWLAIDLRLFDKATLQ